jgi:hypothetical protein
MSKLVSHDIYKVYIIEWLIAKSEINESVLQKKRSFALWV